MRTLIHNNKGFTLVEMMISMVVFIIFMGTLFSTYGSVISAQRDSSDVRVMYAGARDLFELLVEDVRLSTVDYFCSTNSSSRLALLSKDGLKRTIYELVDNDDGFKVLQKSVALRDGQSDPFATQGESQQVSADDLKIERFAFYFTPQDDPYGLTSLNAVSNQLQPQVTILAQFVSSGEEGGEFHFPLQATISSRVYSKVDQRDRIRFEGVDDPGLRCN